MKEKLLIIGTSATARHVYDFVTSYDLYDVVGFAVDAEYKNQETFCGCPVYDLENISEQFDMEKIKVFVAVLWNHVNADRKKIFCRLEEKGYHFANLISPTARIRGKVTGKNCWIHDYVIIQSGACIEDDCLLMAFSLVGSNTHLAAHCFMGTKSTVAGGCKVGQQTFIGINCTVFDDTDVGEKCVLGACTAVKRNVEPFTVVKTAHTNTVTEKYLPDTIEQKLMFSKNKR